MESGKEGSSRKTTPFSTMEDDKQLMDVSGSVPMIGTFKFYHVIEA
jgi:hypothetical protein